MLEIKRAAWYGVLALLGGVMCGCSDAPTQSPIPDQPPEKTPDGPGTPDGSGRGNGDDGDDDGAKEEPPKQPDLRDPNELVEDRSVYEQDDLTVHVIRLTVTDEDGLEDVYDDEPGAEVDALLEADGFEGNTTAPNATLRLRGAAAREARQKSFRIKLAPDVGLWRGHRTIHLNKHPYDLVRVRQKLSFDFFAEIRHMASLRTSFVRLFINGEDMGLFTQIEHPGELFLRDHGLDPAGQIYKAEDLDFTRISDDVWNDPEALDEVVEVKANPDHAKFREMIDAINDVSRDIDDIIDTYFHRDNYLTWWAANLLMSNFDTTMHNFLLYSPSTSRRWYFLPWDYDDAWGFHGQPGNSPRGRPVSGPGNWWHIYLHRRFLEKAGNMEELLGVVQRLGTEVITEQRTAELLAGYHDVVRAQVETVPDIEYLPAVWDMSREEKLEVFEQEFARIAGLSTLMQAECIEVQERPMPFYLQRPDVDDDMATFTWTESFDLQGDEITYDVQVGTSVTFAPDTIVQEQTGLSSPEAEISLPQGRYLWRVIARDSANPEINWQVARDSYEDEETDMEYRGIREVEVD